MQHSFPEYFRIDPFDFLGDARAVVNQAPSGLGPSGFHPCRTLVDRRRGPSGISRGGRDPCSGSNHCSARLGGRAVRDLTTTSCTVMMIADAPCVGNPSFVDTTHPLAACRTSSGHESLKTIHRPLRASAADAGGLLLAEVPLQVAQGQTLNSLEARWISCPI